MWFGLLTSYMPGILATMIPSDSNEPNLQLHLSAAAQVVDDLSPPLNKDQSHQLLKWLDKLRLCQNAIESILNPESHSPLVTDLRLTFSHSVCILCACEQFECLSFRLRMKWHRLQAMQIFIEQVVIKFDNTEKYGNRLYHVSQRVKGTIFVSYL